MTRQLYFILILFLPTVLFGQKQNRDFAKREKDRNSEKKLASLVSNFTTQLKKKGIRDIGFTEHYCIGSIDTSDFLETVCDYETTYKQCYVFWKDSNKVFIKKFDNCGAFNQLIIGDTYFFDFYEQNKVKIKTEKVESAETIEIKGTDTIELLYSTGHSCISQIIIYDNKSTIKKHIDFFDLSEKIEINGKPNSNFQTNSRLKMVEWDKGTSEIIDQLEKNNKFKRQK